MQLSDALEAWKQRRRAVLERARDAGRPFHLRSTVIMVATTEYHNRDQYGAYINPHLYRMPVSVSAVELPA